MKYLAILALTLLPTTALAQGNVPLQDEQWDDERASPFEDTLDQADRERYLQRTNTPEARQAIENYGKCVVGREPGEASRLLTMDFKTARYRTALRLLAREAERNCAHDTFGRGVMRSAGLLFSGAIAEALLEADATPLNARLVRNANMEVTSYSATDSVALCLARSLPDQVMGLFETAPASEAEKAAATPLTQAVPACAGAAGIAAKIELTVPALRAMVATASYRLVNAAEQGGKEAA